MSDLTKTIKLRIHVTPEQEILFHQMTERYRQACNFVSQYIFDNEFNSHCFDKSQRPVDKYEGENTSAFVPDFDANL